MFVIPADASIGVLVPDPGFSPPSNEPVLLDPRVELRTLNMPFLPKENRPSAERSALFIVPTEDSVAADMEAARVLVFR